MRADGPLVETRAVPVDKVRSRQPVLLERWVKPFRLGLLHEKDPRIQRVVDLVHKLIDEVLGKAAGALRVAVEVKERFCAPKLSVVHGFRW